MVKSFQQLTLIKKSINKIKKIMHYTYLGSHWVPLDLDGKNLICIDTCTCPAQIHGLQLAYTEKESALF